MGSSDDIKELIDQMDTSGNGCIQQETFMAATLNRSLLERKDLLKSVFDKFDLNRDGLIGDDDYVQVLEELHLLSPASKTDQASASYLSLMIQDKALDFDQFVSLVFQAEADELDLRQPSCFGQSFGRGSSCAVM
jgi:Ca2+-binding EF-hand superfamily protein